jgi:hypothetical protein
VNHLLLTFLFFYLVALLAAILSGRKPAFLWGTWRRLTRGIRTRRNARRAVAVSAALAEMDARESELLRERILGGANIIALLDRSQVEPERAPLKRKVSA